MKLSKKTLYAILLILAIAKNGANENVTMKEIAEKEHISVKFLEQIVNVLCKAGFVRSRRGSRGGYRLSKPADKYTLGSIIRVMEGTADLDYTEELKPLAGFLKGLCNAVNSYMDSVTISDLIEEEKIINGIYDYCI